MATHHVCKQTHGKSCGLCEHAEYFNDLHDGYRAFQPYGNIGPEDFFPVVLVGHQVGDKECDYGKNESDGDIAGEVSTAGEYHNQAEKVHRKDKEEYGDEIGGKLAGLGAESRLNDTVVDECDKGFYSTEAFAGSLETIFTMEGSEPEEQASDEKHGNEERGDIFCDGNVEGAYFLSVDDFHDFAFVRAAIRSEAEQMSVVVVCFTAGDMRRREAVESVGAVYYYGKRDAMVMVEGHFPTICVAKVLENDFLGVQFLVRGGVGRCRCIISGKSRAYSEQENCQYCIQALHKLSVDTNRHYIIVDVGDTAGYRGLTFGAGAVYIADFARSEC